MKKCAIIIGVNKTGGLPVLAAAVQGAKDFANWAESQEFDISLLTDEFSPVRVEEIKVAVKQYVDKKIYDQMLIYFAGHGIMTTPTEECWLLSNAPDDPDEAISSYTTEVFAQLAGIPHIVIIADACRTSTQDYLLTMVSGKSIIPNRNIGQGDVDRFWATRPGSSALEVRRGNQFKAIFTDCMLKGLRGEIPELIKTIDEDKQKKSVIFPYELGQFLKEHVPLIAEEASILHTQEPSIKINSRPPKHISIVTNSNQQIVFDIPVVLEKTRNTELEMDFHTKFSLTKEDDYSIDSEQRSKLLNWYQNENLQLIPGCNAGFSITGSSSFNLVLDYGTYEIVHGMDPENHLIGIKSTTKTRTLLFIGASGISTPLAILPGFIASILVKNDRIIDINYVPTTNNPRFNKSLIRSDEIMNRRATAAIDAKNGTFQIEGSPDQIIHTASYLRYDKALDPILGLYASYAYAQTGNIRDIQSVFKYMSKEVEPIIYDVKLLSITLSESSLKDFEQEHAPFCPMLTQGWSLISNDSLLGKEIKHLGKYLIPGLWTTFNEEGTRLIINYLNSQNI